MNKKWTILTGGVFIVLVGVLVFVILKKPDRRMGAIPLPGSGITENFRSCGERLILIEPAPIFVEKQGKFTISNLTSNDVAIETLFLYPRFEMSNTDFMLKGEESKDILITKNTSEEPCFSASLRIRAKQGKCEHHMLIFLVLRRLWK